MLNRIRSSLGRWIARFLSRPIVRSSVFVTYTTKWEKELQEGDVLLVEGSSRISECVKYLTQSTWSHSALYVGEHSPHYTKDGERCSLIEAEINEGVIASPLSKYKDFHVRICRPHQLRDHDRQRLIAYMLDSVGQQYDLKNIIDLCRYFIRTPPVPVRFRRRMLALGSGDPSRAICSSLIASAFQLVEYPILPVIEKHMEVHRYYYSIREIYHIQHHSLFVPKDFDVSPFFYIIKPTLEQGFDYKKITLEKDVPTDELD